MKSLLEFKTECIEKPCSKLENTWLRIQYLLSNWGVSEEKIDSFDTKKFLLEYNESKEKDSNFECKFIKSIIEHSLDLKSIFWKNSFDIKFFSKSDVTPYYTVDFNSIEFWISSKREVMSKIKGDVILDNYDNFIEFIQDKNNIYKKLEEINELFPITIYDCD